MWSNYADDNKIGEIIRERRVHFYTNEQIWKFILNSLPFSWYDNDKSVYTGFSVKGTICKWSCMSHLNQKTLNTSEETGHHRKPYKTQSCDSTNHGVMLLGLVLLHFSHVNAIQAYSMVTQHCSYATRCYSFWLYFLHHHQIKVKWQFYFLLLFFPLALIKEVIFVTHSSWELYVFSLSFWVTGFPIVGP